MSTKDPIFRPTEFAGVTAISEQSGKIPEPTQCGKCSIGGYLTIGGAAKLEGGLCLQKCGEGWNLLYF